MNKHIEAIRERLTVGTVLMLAAVGAMLYYWIKSQVKPRDPNRVHVHTLEDDHADDAQLEWYGRQK